MARSGARDGDHRALRCIHEFGLACEPLVEDLLAEIGNAAVTHLDQTPWYQHGALRWLWVATSATTVVFHIGSRSKQELTRLIGEAFVGWLVSDGYGAYRDHPRRQRCLAHLIRKAVALAEGYHAPGSAFGAALVRDLRKLIAKLAAGDPDDGTGSSACWRASNGLASAINIRLPTRSAPARARSSTIGRQ